MLLVQPAAPATSEFETLSEISVLELPHLAARMVGEAPKAEQGAVARELLQKVNTLSKPGLIPFTVSAISRVAPDAADETVSTAAALQPQDALYIAKAALNAAPSKTEAIVEAICRQVPQSYPWVAVMAIDADSGGRARILRAISSAIPVLALPIEQAQRYSGDCPMSELMEKVHELATAAYQEEIAHLKRTAIENALQNSDAVSASEHGGDVAQMPASIDQGANMNGTVRARLAALDRGVTRELMESGLIPSCASEMGYLLPQPSYIQPDSGAKAP